MVLCWLVAPAIGVMVVIALTSNPGALSDPAYARNMLPIEFLAAGVEFVGWVCFIVGLFRALKTLDFLGRREYSRMEDEERYARS